MRVGGRVLALIVVVLSVIATTACSGADMTRAEFVEYLGVRLKTTDGLSDVLELNEVDCIASEVADRADDAGSSYAEWVNVLDGHKEDDAVNDAFAEGFAECASFGELMGRTILNAGATDAQAACIASDFDADDSFALSILEALGTPPNSDLRAETVNVIESRMREALAACL